MNPPADGAVPVPVLRGVGGLELEDLLDELRARASVARRAQERMGDLLEAVMAVSADLELGEVLSRIVQAAMSLVDARYGALGVVSDDGEHLVEFITRGVTDAERARIGDLPRGHGILGLLIRDPQPRRLRDISEHPDSFGFPPNHPPMRSFLGAPVRIRSEVYGNLYMAQKQGADEFTAEDEAVLVALAAAAGVAIDNARLYDSSRRQRQWIEAVGEVTQILLEREDEEAATRLMTEHAGRLSMGSHAVLALSDESGDLVVRDVCRIGDAAAHHDPGVPGRRQVLAGSHWAQARRVRQPLLMLAPSSAAMSGTGLRADVCRVAEVAADSPIAVLPLSPGRGDLGVLVVVWDAEAETMPEETMPAVTEYAQQAGLALLAGRAQRDRSRMALIDDRDRIARDMHDHVIQRLFATGLSLQSAGRMAQQPMVRSRLDEAVDDLDAAIKEIRHAIFELHQPLPDTTRMHELEQLVESFSPALGFLPELVVHGQLTDMSPSPWSDVLAVVREGLSNVTRHAHATRVGVRVSATDTVVVEVRDDGVGTDSDDARSGLVNLRDRALRASGGFDVSRTEPGGTLLRWQVPVPTP